MSKYPLTALEIDKMCDRLKYKYPQYGKRDDLKSEAIVAVYERLHSHPDSHPAELYNAARLAMSDFINLKDRVIALPVNPTSRAVASQARQKVPKSSEYGDSGLAAMYDALQPTKEYIEGDSGNRTQTEDCTEGYEAREFIAKSMKLLTDKERELINMRYFQDKTQGHVADVYKVSQKTVHSWEAKALEKMSRL
tara:strand:+ start:516 stop:1097 length:582 start_codon:yes stop_codon:yes gene_type:complete